MTSSIIVKQIHSDFLFNGENTFNAFNLIRLMESILDDEELNIDICSLSKKEQNLIVSKVLTVLKLIRILSNNKEGLVQIAFSSVDELCLKESLASAGGELAQKTLIFELPSLPTINDNKLDPHYVKNVRGAVLLSLAADLIENNVNLSSLTLFNTPSKISLHSAASFLYNDENASLMWKVLKHWNAKREEQFQFKIKQLIRTCKDKLEIAKSITASLGDRTTPNAKNLKNLTEQLQSFCGLSEDIFASEVKPLAWLIDDQYANGWERLMSHMLMKIGVKLECFGSIEDMRLSLNALEEHKIGSVPDLAFVDLRLSNEDSNFETYDSNDLSGFTVLENLLAKWPGLPIVIASASNKLWNFEKALNKGATGYWRKSDEDHGSGVNENAVDTALAIYKHFTEKTTTALLKVRFRYVFRITESLKAVSYQAPINNTALQRSVMRYCNDAPRKVSLMLLRALDEPEMIDNLFLGVMELFNEIESLLWNPDTDGLTCVPDTKVRSRAEKVDKLIINDTLEHLNTKYGLNGISLESHYSRVKRVRNKLPFVHGSQASNDVCHAEIIDLEVALLLVWVLSNELVCSSSEA